MSKYKDVKIGVLALQGDFEKHLEHIAQVGAVGVQIKLPKQLAEIDGLIIPGGESTTIDKLIDRFELRQPLIDFAAKKAVYGTCAGMIMVAKNIENNQAHVTPLGLIDIDVERTAYGRQVFSFDENIDCKLDGEISSVPVSFIRAPIITRCGEQVEKLAVYLGKPVLVKEGNILAGSFHAELGEDTRILEYFIERFLLP